MKVLCGETGLELGHDGSGLSGWAGQEESRLLEV